jgi:hypothetical protein
MEWNLSVSWRVYPAAKIALSLRILKNTKIHFELFKTSNLAWHLTSCGIFSLLGYTILYYKNFTDVIVAVSK